ncbi:MAG: Rrf2 family transcriptional regulator [Phycisphaeraceae bacterium]
MLSLTKKSDYALVALAYLGLRWHDQTGPASARQVAASFDLPAALLMNIMKDLASAGIVTSTRGARGGYELAREPGEINLLDVFVALEGPIHLVECCTDRQKNGTCSIAEGCPVRLPMQKLDRRLQSFFRSVSLQDLITSDADAPMNSDRVALTRSGHLTDPGTTTNHHTSHPKPSTS